MSVFTFMILIAGMLISAANIGLIISSKIASKRFHNKIWVFHSFGASVLYLIILLFLACFSDTFPVIIVGLIYIFFAVCCLERANFKEPKFYD